jgi:CBS domain-containing protein
MRIVEIMSRKVRTVKPTDAADIAWDRMRLHRIHHLIVVKDAEIVGVVTDRDLGSRHGGELRRGRSVRDLMSPSVTTVASSTSVREAANVMRGHRAGCLPVVDDGVLVGIVTVWDFLDLIGRGADRPVAEAERRVLKHRGQKPHGQAAARLASRAKKAPARF